MESLLERGEKLDDLVAKSEHLGNQSKAFYKTVSNDDSPSWHWTESLMAIHCLDAWLCACVFMLTLQARKQNSCCEIMWNRCLVLVDTPLSAFLLVLQLPSCTCHQLSTQGTEQTLSNPEWGARLRAGNGRRWWPVGVWPVRIVTDGGWRSDGVCPGNE